MNKVVDHSRAAGSVPIINKRFLKTRFRRFRNPREKIQAGNTSLNEYHGYDAGRYGNDHDQR